MLCVALVLVLAAPGIVLAAPQDTIPPEILKQFDKDILSGKRPKIAKMAQGNIFSLRTNPKFDADFVRLAFNPGKLSKVQKEIFAKWLEGGHSKILLLGVDKKTYAAILGVQAHMHSSKKPKHYPLEINSRTQPTVDVDKAIGLQSPYHAVGIKEGSSSSLVSVARYSATSAAMGFFTTGKTKVYFMPLELKGPDADRLRLNFYQWAMGLKVPGAANTNVAGASATTAATLEEQGRYDKLSLRNGDTVSGTLTSKTITVKASYGQVEFPLGKIARLLIEGEGKNVDAIILKNGDMISGVIEEGDFLVKLTNDKVISISKDKIQEIVLQAKRDVRGASNPSK